MPVLVDGVGGVDDGVVDRDHLALDRGEELADALGRLDLADLLAGGRRGAHGGQFDVDDVTELLGGVVGDADGDGVALDEDPLVVGGVLQCGLVGHGISLSGCDGRRGTG